MPYLEEAEDRAVVVQELLQLVRRGLLHMRHPLLVEVRDVRIDRAREDEVALLDLLAEGRGEETLVGLEAEDRLLGALVEVLGPEDGPRRGRRLRPSLIKRSYVAQGPKSLPCHAEVLLWGF